MSTPIDDPWYAAHRRWVELVTEADIERIRRYEREFRRAEDWAMSYGFSGAKTRALRIADNWRLMQRNVRAAVLRREHGQES